MEEFNHSNFPPGDEANKEKCWELNNQSQGKMYNRGHITQKFLVHVHGVTVSYSEYYRHTGGMIERSKVYNYYY